MPETAIVRMIDGKPGVMIPAAVIERLKISEGDVLVVAERDGGILLTPCDPTFQRAMDAYRRGASKHRDALRRLAEG